MLENHGIVYLIKALGTFLNPEMPIKPNDRLRAEQVAALYKNVTIGVIGAAITAILLAATLISLDAIGQVKGIAWTSYIAICAILHIALRRMYQRTASPEVDWKLWGRYFAFMSLTEGLGWGWASAYLVNPDRFDFEMLVIVVSLMVAVGAVSVFGSYLPAFFALFIPITFSCLFWSYAASAQYPPANAMFWMVSMFIMAVSALGVRTNLNFKELVGLRIRTSELAVDLRQQKELAEAANLAKSSFLAAASHDLRQPVHALGLFAGALRGARIPAEAMIMVEQIEASATAMDSLFSALLDISKLDAGVVEVQKHSFAIQPLLDRICREYAEDAQAKSLSITQHYCSAIVRTDPILLERILRNLVSNAVRYTGQGRVIIGCRRRPNAICVQVLDTGIGIAQLHQERVFQEYFQLQNPERDRAKGLGLGLAIVRRLTDLLNCKLELKSRQGHGSMFSITIPLAYGDADYSEQHSDLILESKASGFVVVIDDELAIREAMSCLLESWGFNVIVAGSGDEMLAELATCSMRPDLIICDYRLRVGENGIKVIERLQSEYNEPIPAMLITGDTAGDRLIEAQASGFLLLHKPVANSKLRAAIANLMAASNAGVND